MKKRCNKKSLCSRKINRKKKNLCSRNKQIDKKEKTTKLTDIVSEAIDYWEKEFFLSRRHEKVVQIATAINKAKSGGLENS